ncbi:cytidine and deoxycytidylate deaminase zinc-binding region domain-containing protein [Toxoplasma gondii MAS]|uniref:dCMP deaminase n=1 Tax=Toxoplasma gondii MAS TaxID=943118 RepID=A0A086PMG7_TOXGO|nr:cytidine and deoxycytidylate deaminase zinc-binding region domain-containing protein [Toxoplasma gondii MAS]
MVVLGLVGPLQSGKRSVAKILEEDFSFKILYLSCVPPVSSASGVFPASCPLRSAQHPPCLFDSVSPSPREGGRIPAEEKRRPSHLLSPSASNGRSSSPPDVRTPRLPHTQLLVSSSRGASESSGGEVTSSDADRVSEEERKTFSPAGSCGANGCSHQVLSVSATRDRPFPRTVDAPESLACVSEEKRYDSARQEGKAAETSTARPPESRASSGSQSPDASFLSFSDPEQIVDFVTSRWRENFVVLGISRLEEVRVLRKRPFFALVAVDAPLGVRLARMRAKAGLAFSMEEMIAREDQLCFRPSQSGANSPAAAGVDGVRVCMAVADVHLMADGCSSLLRQKIASAGFLCEELVRPSWDTYFMRLTFLASTRSNCMKRRVGAIVARGNRVIATGYNGTPSQAANCNAGGCARCNDPSVSQGRALEACECIHAEANALLEAGRDRAMNGTLYVTCLPCLGCAKLVVQSAIRTVVYAEEYDDKSGALDLLNRMGVSVRRFADDHPGVPGMTVAVKSF